jgi:hypothetical protein
MFRRLSCPVLVCEAVDDHFSPGQAQRVAAALRSRATLRSFTAEESAGTHSHPSSVETTASDGSLLGPFNASLFNPLLGAAQVAVFRADKASTSLPARLHEIVALTIGGAWDAKYEIYAHSAMASRAGTNF